MDNKKIIRRRRRNINNCQDIIRCTRKKQRSSKQCADNRNGHTAAPFHEEAALQQNAETALILKHTNSKIFPWPSRFYYEDYSNCSNKKSVQEYKTDGTNYISISDKIKNTSEFQAISRLSSSKFYNYNFSEHLRKKAQFPMHANEENELVDSAKEVTGPNLEVECAESQHDNTNETVETNCGTAVLTDSPIPASGKECNPCRICAIHFEKLERRLIVLENLYKSLSRSVDPTDSDDSVQFITSATGPTELCVKTERLSKTESALSTKSSQQCKKSETKAPATNITEKKQFIQFECDESSADIVKVYTSSVKDEKGACALGVWFGERHPLNVAQLMNHETEPNTRALCLKATFIAVQIAKAAGMNRILLYTYSTYVYNVIKRLNVYKARHWRKKSGAFIKNRKEIRELRKAIASMAIEWRLVAPDLFVFGAEKARQLAYEALAGEG